MGSFGKFVWSEAGFGASSARGRHLRRHDLAIDLAHDYDYYKTPANDYYYILPATPANVNCSISDSDARLK